MNKGKVNQMSIVDRLKKGIIFSTKVTYLKIIIIFLLIFSIAFIDQSQIDAIRLFAIGLITVTVFFQVTAVLKGVLNLLRTASNELKKELITKKTCLILKEVILSNSFYTLSIMLSITIKILRKLNL